MRLSGCQRAAGNLNTPVQHDNQGLLAAIAGMQQQLRTMVSQVASQANRLMEYQGLSGHVGQLSQSASQQSESTSSWRHR